jgi:GrpB-like predicted nucleotidyltransferase (UPF0157 family)
VSEEQPLICPYDPLWPVEYERLRRRALAALGDGAVTVEHVGSTAVPGLAAKPVVDLDVVVAAPDDVGAAVRRLATLGYEAGARGGIAATIEGLTALGWPRGEQRHQLYVVVAGSRPHRERLAFRDYLRSNTPEARRYAELKRHAASECGDEDRYAERKYEFIQRALQIALAD